MPPLPALVLIVPSSITNSGGSASVSASGKVTFTNVTSVSLNGVFSAAYDNYMIVVSHDLGGSTSDSLMVRMRASGADASAANYDWQYVDVNNTSVAALRLTSQGYGRIGGMSGSNSGWIPTGGTAATICAPFLAEPTVARGINVNGKSTGAFDEYGFSHTLSTSYDGITLFEGSVGSKPMIGVLTVYGINQ